MERSTHNRSLICLIVLLTVVALGAVTALPAGAQEKVSLRLDFVINGYHGPFFTALGKGYYREEGLDVEVLRGFGSGDTVKRVGTGANTFGFADFFTTVKGVAEGARVKAIGTCLGDGPGAIIALKKSGIRTLKDLEGRSLASSPGNAFGLQLPALFRAAGLDFAKVKYTEMDIVLKSSALMAGKVDAITGIIISEVPAFKVMDVIEYRDHLKIVGSGILAHQDTLRGKPETVRRFLRASFRGARDFVRNVPESVEFLARSHPEIDRPTYREQANSSLTLWASATAKEKGFGWLDEAKVANTIEVAAQAYKLPRRVSAGDFYTNEFVPVPPIRP
ncbi:MAG: ABC transporter substrate-binding protein [Deltaproteobacteria bacterium]|nr:ABC transporter substrate-binding protein [Deltaproteobacteria bacterium]